MITVLGTRKALLFLPRACSEPLWNWNIEDATRPLLLEVVADIVNKIPMHMPNIMLMVNLAACRIVSKSDQCPRVWFAQHPQPFDL
jgi:hypothetical protein